jgi:hypothetical protein
MYIIDIAGFVDKYEHVYFSIEWNLLQVRAVDLA